MTDKLNKELYDDFYNKAILYRKEYDSTAWWKFIKRGDLLAKADSARDLMAMYGSRRQEAQIDLKLRVTIPELLKTLNQLSIDLKLLKNNLVKECEINSRFEGMPEEVEKWIISIEKIIKK